MNWPRVLSALRWRNYRLFFFGQIVSLVGTWMSTTASLWLAYNLSSSSIQLGLVGFASQAPVFLLAPFGGVMADRLNAHRLLIATQVLSMLQSFALAGLTLSGQMTPGWLIFLSFIQGAINGIDFPTRQSLISVFVDRREHLGNAIALNSSMFNLARLLGPAVGGLVVAAYGAGVCYLVDGFSYAAVIVSLFAMKLRPREKNPQPAHPLRQMQEGFVAAFGFRPMRVLMITIALVSAFGFSYSVLTPMFARDVFAGDARVLGCLMSAAGIGALLAAGYLANRSTIRGLGTVVATGACFMGGGLICFALSRHLPLAMASLALVGMGGVLTMASSNTIVQTLVPQERRGRVMSIFTMAFTGTMPIGNLIAGWAARFVGPGFTLACAGCFCAGVGLVFLRALPELRAATAPLLDRLESAEASV